MTCLTQEDVLRVSLEESESEAFAEHLAVCPVCREAVARLRAVDAQLAAAHEELSFDHDAQRSRLLSALEERRAVEPATRVAGISNLWTGGLTVAQRTLIGGFAVCALLAGVMLWVGSPTRHASAMERMADNVRRAKSYELTMVGESQPPQKQGKSPDGSLKFLWQAPGSIRIEEVGPNSQCKEIRIYPAKQPGISINSEKKQYRRLPPQLGEQLPLSTVDAFGRFEGRADRELGTKQVEGHRARGFEVDMKKVDPSANEGTVEVWLDEATDLPVLVRMTVDAPLGGTFVMRNIRWNFDVDPKLFDTTPPEGYKDVTPPPLGLDEQVAIFRDGLTTFAELSGGHYPRVTIIYGDVTLDEMKRMAKIDTPATDEQIRSDEYVKVQRAVRAFSMLNRLCAENPDMAYHGKTVAAKDKDQVLLRWQLDDGRYAVMYGDLRSETVSPERLRELEAH